MTAGNVITPYLARLSDLPAAYIDEAAATFTRIAERNGGTMMGRYQLTAAEESRRVTPDGASIMMYGSPAGFWTWKESGASAHTIRPRRKKALAGGLGHPVRGPVRHPGFAGQEAWTRTVAQAEEEISTVLNDLAAKAAA